MKLLDILARELESWQFHSLPCVTQEGDAQLWYATTDAEYRGEIAWYSSDGSYGPHLRSLADDWKTAIITRADWEQARAELKGETKMPKSNKDGWIRWRGGKCPVDAGVIVEVRFRDGEIKEPVSANAWAWNHTNDDDDIMAYRLHKPEEAQKIACDTDVLTDGLLVQPAHTYSQECRWQFSEPEMPAAKYFQDGPLQWRDRIREIDATTAQMAQERASLVERLASEGLALIERDESNAAAGSAQGEDMSDPANWKAGDLIRCVEGEYGEFTVGKIYMVSYMEPRWANVIEDDDGDANALPPNCFTWASRPTT